MDNAVESVSALSSKYWQLKGEFAGVESSFAYLKCVLCNNEDWRFLPTSAKIGRVPVVQENRQAKIVPHRNRGKGTVLRRWNAEVYSVDAVHRSPGGPPLQTCGRHSCNELERIREGNHRARRNGGFCEQRQRCPKHHIYVNDEKQWHTRLFCFSTPRNLTCGGLFLFYVILFFDAIANCLQTRRVGSPLLIGNLQDLNNAEQVIHIAW